MRRSTRIPLDGSIEVDSGSGILKGVTVVVNLHGALIRTIKPIATGSKIRVKMNQTGHASTAIVVYVASDNPLTSGIELETPQNIWGVQPAPADWQPSPPKKWN